MCYVAVVLRSCCTHLNTHIGLILIDSSVHDVYVQLSNISSPELRLLHLNQLLLSLIDLSLVPRPSVLQTLFISSGCDYISFFVGLGKATIMKHFFGLLQVPRIYLEH